MRWASAGRLGQIVLGQHLLALRKACLGPSRVWVSLPALLGRPLFVVDEVCVLHIVLHCVVADRGLAMLLPSLIQDHGHGGDTHASLQGPVHGVAKAYG